MVRGRLSSASRGWPGTSRGGSRRWCVATETWQPPEKREARENRSRAPSRCSTFVLGCQAQEVPVAIEPARLAPGSPRSKYWPSRHLATASTGSEHVSQGRFAHWSTYVVPLPRIIARVAPSGALPTAQDAIAAHVRAARSARGGVSPQSGLTWPKNRPSLGRGLEGLRILPRGQAYR